ncbi:MAG: hypothetical protein H6842_10635 [Rhodospirillaceae bacterium]|nr:hypothetical protein [Rhodospirillaceae bacterium]
MVRLFVFLGAAVAVAAAGLPARAASIGDYFGVYVGASEVIADGQVVGHRDLDLEITAEAEDGFSVRLISVATVDGRRDVPGVERWYRALKFRPDGDGWAIDMRRSLFTERQRVDVEEGDEVLRAHIQGDSLIVSSDFIDSSGARIQQLFDFRLTETGLETRYVREVDGVAGRETRGRLIRIE